MPSQVVMDGHANGANGTNGAHAPSIAPRRAAGRQPRVDLDGFAFDSIDQKLSETKGAATVAPPIVQQAALGPLAAFKGTFTGTGMNTIFRPANAATPSTTKFDNPVAGPAFPQVPNDNVLEINLTEETLTFTAPLGNVPNRGFGQQKDTNLNGVMYVQTVNDVTNETTGEADGAATNIHVEPGLWMHVPATSDPADQDPTVVRMASIPHGTTINAQGISPTTIISGKPNFDNPKNILSVQPFPIGSAQGPNNPVPPFPSQKANNPNTSRLPQDLSKFITAGTINDELIENPNLLLKAAIADQNIISFQVFSVSTSSSSTANPVTGGGISNIQFLSGDTRNDGPNADAIQMRATFWIETVEHQLTVPPFSHGSQQPVQLQPQVANAKVPVPTFLVSPPAHHMTAAQTVTVRSTQIQYSQVVLLNFGGLSWPHISVATLVPASPIPLSIPGLPA